MLRTKGRRRRPVVEEAKKQFRVNHQIKVPEVRVIDEDGEQLGILKVSQALALAEERGYDLVEVFPLAVPPVCKLLELGKFLYQQAKKNQEQKSKVKAAEIKGVRLSLKIGQHDFDFRVEQAKKFLQQGNKVKVEIILKGREKQYGPAAADKILAFIGQLGEIVIEQPVKRQGGQLFALITPKKNN